MAIERWQPFEALRNIEDFMRLPFMGTARPFSWWRVPTEELAWSPAVEMYEKPDKFVVKMEVPGMEEKDIDISFANDTLTITGERKTESEVKDDEYYRCELSYGKFTRSLTIPTAVKSDKLEASYHNGILEITLPKAEQAKQKKIPITHHS